MGIRKTIAEKLLSPFYDFIQNSRAVGITLIVCTVLSLLLANSHAGPVWLNFWSPASTAGDHYWHLGPLQLPNNVQLWINDGGMAVFFFFAGMEIKKELLTGELSTFRKAILPAAGAIGGMLLPAAFFTFFNYHSIYAPGWGIPMATDIAFSLGIASVLGSRVPVSAKIFLTALAIIDDLGAIVTIAVFYSAHLHFIYLLVALAIFFALLAIGNRTHFRWMQLPLGLLLWYCIFNSGIHATVAGVLFAFAMPARQIDHLTHRLHVPVYFIVLPLFALANTAIVLPAHPLYALTSTLSIGILAGLVLGKTFGILLACLVMVKLKIAMLPGSTTWRHMTGISLLAGIGFTMSIFIAMLAFDTPGIQNTAKMAVLTGSIVAALAAIVWFKTIRPTT